MSENKLTFEKALIDLETIVEKLEATDVPLEKAIDYYQEGMKLAKVCEDKLSDAKEKITHILNEDDELEVFVTEEEV